MRLTFGSSKNGDVAEALKNISSPAALFFTVADEKMLEHTAIEIEKVFSEYTIYWRRWPSIFGQTVF